MTANKKTLDEPVPGMAEAIETRRKSLGMSPGMFAEAAGLTGPGLMPLRKGYRRQYQDKLKLGVARALRWPPDAIDRLMAGEDPANFGDPDPTSPAGAALPREPIGLAAKAGKLSPEARAKLEGYLDALLDEQES